MLLAKHRDGTCVPENKSSCVGGAASVKTLCGYFVTLPFGYPKDRRPTCHECRDILSTNPPEEQE